MYIYLFNRSGSENIGDQLIGKTITGYLEKLGHKVNVNSVYPVPAKKILRIRMHFLSFLNDIRQIYTCDIFIIGGGNLIMDTAGSAWAIHHFWLSLVSLAFKKKYYYLAVGMNPLKLPLAQFLFRFALKKAYKISVRDSFSKGYVEQLTGRDDIVLHFDPVLSVSTIYSSVKSISNNLAVGLCPVQLDFPSIGAASPSVYKRYVSLHVKLIEHFCRAGQPVILFLNDFAIDEKVANDILARISVNEDDGFSFINKFDTITVYLEFIAGLDFLVGSRMHAIISAKNFGVPCVGLGWQSKMEALFLDQNFDGFIKVLDVLKTDNGEKDLFEEIVNFYEAVRLTPKNPLDKKIEFADFLKS